MGFRYDRDIACRQARVHQWGWLRYVIYTVQNNGCIDALEPDAGAAILRVLNLKADDSPVQWLDVPLTMDIRCALEHLNLIGLAAQAGTSDGRTGGIDDADRDSISTAGKRHCQHYDQC